MILNGQINLFRTPHKCLTKIENLINSMIQKITPAKKKINKTKQKAGNKQTEISLTKKKKVTGQRIKAKIILKYRTKEFLIK